MELKETFDYIFIWEKLPKLFSALPLTLLITALAIFFGWLLGLIVAIGKVGGPKWLRKFLFAVTDIIRGIPTVVLMYIVYFGLSVLLSKLFSITVTTTQKYIYIVSALMIEISATGSELFRSAYSSIPRGQLEAAQSLGYTGLQKFVHVIVPQGIRVILPNLGNTLLATIQSTALLYTLGIYDLLGRARQIDTNVTHMKTFELYLAVAVIYWILGALTGWIFKRLEGSFAKGSREIAI